MFSPSTTFLALATWMAAANMAHAESRLMVLSSTGGPERPSIDAAVIATARSDIRFHLVDRPLRVDAARRESRCPVLDDACLRRIANRRDADRILYGSFGPSPTDTDETLFTLRLFDRYTGETRETLVGRIETDHLDDDEEVGKLLAKLVPLVLRLPEEGGALVRVYPGAVVELDGRAMGTVPDSGELELRPLRVGRRVLRVERANLPAWEAPIVIRARDSVRVTVGTGGAPLEASLSNRRAALPEGTIEPPPEWILAIPGDPPPSESTDVFTFGIGLSRVRFSIPVIEEHVQRGEIRTTTNARVGFLPHVSSSGARVTAKLRF